MMVNRGQWVVQEHVGHATGRGITPRAALTAAWFDYRQSPEYTK